MRKGNDDNDEDKQSNVSILHPLVGRYVIQLVANNRFYKGGYRELYV